MFNWTHSSAVCAAQEQEVWGPDSLPSQQNATVFWDMLMFCATVAQKVAVRQKQQVATVYAYFYAAAVPLFLKKRYSCMLVYMLL